MGREYTKNNLVFGWGVNDVDYNVYRYEIVKGKWKIVWKCPYYAKWVGILERCLCPKFKEKWPTYNGCTDALLDKILNTYKE
jgi:hypothetical protein